MLAKSNEFLPKIHIQKQSKNKKMFKNKKLVRIYDFQKLFQIRQNLRNIEKIKKNKNEKIRFSEMTFSGNLWLKKEIHIRKIIIFLKIRVKNQSKIAKFQKLQEK